MALSSPRRKRRRLKQAACRLRSVASGPWQLCCYRALHLILLPTLLVAAALNGAFGTDAVSRDSDDPAEAQVLFYMYKDPVFSPSICHEKLAANPTAGLYYHFAALMLERLSDHPWRTKDWRQAELFVVPFDGETSFTDGACKGSTHLDRIGGVISFLKASPLYQAQAGRDHFWPMPSWRLWHYSDGDDAFFPGAELPLLRNMMIGRYIDAHIYNDRPWARRRQLQLWQQQQRQRRERRRRRRLDDAESDGGGNGNFAEEVSVMSAAAGTSDGGKGSERRGLVQTPHVWFMRLRDAWRCSVSLPVIANDGLYKPDESFEEWQRRKISVFFRGKPSRCRQPTADHARTEALKLAHLINGSLIEASHGQDYVNEIQAARFALVFGCDDPQTSRFVDALAAGAIPVTVDDGFRLAVAPFSRLLNYDTFTVDIQEQMWKANVKVASRFIYTWPEPTLRAMHRSLMQVRPALLWLAPNSTVATWALRQIKLQCLL